MSRVLALDAEALSSLTRQLGPRFRQVHAATEAARRLQRDVVTPAAIRAERYRRALPQHPGVEDLILAVTTARLQRSGRP